MEFGCGEGGGSSHKRRLTVILKLGGHSSCRSPRPSLVSNFTVLRQKVLTPWNLDAERVEEELER